MKLETQQSSSALDSIHALSQDNLSEMATATTGIGSLRATAATLESQVERFHLDVPASRPANSRVSTKKNAQAWLERSTDSQNLSLRRFGS